MTNLDFALNYLENGWSVFPSKGKKPLIAWEPYQKVRPTAQQVIEWWTKWPDADIAGITGEISGIVVVDVDGGEVPPLPPTAVSETSSGNYQYFFKHPGFPVQNSTKVIAPNVDIKADGGYVILPPSRHFNKNTGKQDFTYKWSIPPKDADFADLPEWILEKVKAKKSLDSIVTGSNQGSRNNDATVVAGSLLSKHPQTEWGSICWPLLQGWNEKNNPPLPEKELKSVFDSISQRELSKKNEGRTQSPTQEDTSFLNEKVSLDEALKAVEDVLPGKKDLVLLVLATSISHLIDTKTPLWLMFVGVPSSAKTEVARMLKFNPGVFFLDTLTENAFISGSKIKADKEPFDLLPLLDQRCFVIKDFTTTLSQKEETVRKILGDLTSIYDDSFSKHSPARGTIAYRSFFSILGCVTPQALNKHQRYMNQIGPRFLFFRVPTSEESEVDHSFEVIWTSHSQEKIEEAQKKISAYSYQLSEKLSEITLKKEDRETIDYLNSLAKFIARARGIVLTRQAEFESSDGDRITFYEPIEIQIEEPFRALFQLRVLTRSLAIVTGNQTVTNEGLELIRRVALSSMPADRSLLLSVITKEDKSWSAKDIANHLGISHKTALRQLDELVSLKVLTKTEQGQGLANLYCVYPSFKQILYREVREEFMSHPKVTETQTPPRGLSSTNGEPKPERKEGFHDQRPKLGIPTYD